MRLISWSRATHNGSEPVIKVVLDATLSLKRLPSMRLCLSLFAKRYIQFHLKRPLLRSQLPHADPGFGLLCDTAQMHFHTPLSVLSVRLYQPAAYEASRADTCQIKLPFKGPDMGRPWIILWFALVPGG